MTAFKFARVHPGLTSDFNCAHPDLNEYFISGRDRVEGDLRTVTYALTAEGDRPLGLVSLSNAYIYAPHTWNGDFFGPAVQITALAVVESLQGGGIGTNLVQFLQAFFVIKNKTGCRFMTVNAYNDPRTIRFYKDHCGFRDLAPETEGTIPLYYDLMDTQEVFRENRVIHDQYEAAIISMLKTGTAILPFDVPASLN